MKQAGPKRQREGKGIGKPYRPYNTGSTRIVAQLDVRRLVRRVLSFALELLILVSSVCLLGSWAVEKCIGAVLVPRIGA